MHMRMCFLITSFSQHDSGIYVKLVLYMYYHIIDYVTNINMIRSRSSSIHYSVCLLKNLFNLFNLIPFNLLFIYYFKVATVV